MRDSLAKYQMNTSLNDEEIYNIKHKAWQHGEGLHLNAEQIKSLTKEHQWAIEIIGCLIYGKVKTVKII